MSRLIRFRPFVSALVGLLLGIAGLAAQERLRLPRDPFAAAAALPLQTPVPDGHPVLVVDEQGKPRAGIPVYVLDLDSITRQRRRAVQQAADRTYGGDAESRQIALFALHGTRYVTGADGTVRFKAVARGIVVAVENRTIAVSSVRVREGRELRQLRFVLRPKPGIDVLVVDHRGRPVAGVPVRLVWRSQWGSSSFHDPKKSGADGRLRLDPLGSRPGVSSEVPCVEAQIHAKRLVQIQLDPKTFHNDPARPQRLQLPPYGSVRVYVVDQNGRPVKGIDNVSLRPAHSFELNRQSFGPAEVVEDYATFRFVEVGYSFEATCHYKGQQRPQTVRDQGPRHPGDMRVVTIEGVAAPTVASFRLLDQQGRPVTSETVGVILSMTDYHLTRTTTTDASGRFEVVLEDRFVDADPGTLTVTRRGQGPQLVYLGAARVPLLGIGKRQPFDDLQLKEEKLLVSGRVVDTAGQPVAGVSLSAPNRYQVTPNGSSSRSGGSKYYEHSTVTGPDGAFEFRELDAEDLPILLQTGRGFRFGSKHYFILKGAETKTGTKGHEVVVGLTSKISGSLKGIAKNARFSGHIEVRDAAGAELGSGRRLYASIQSGGKFEINRCPPGEYTLAFKISGQREPFLTVKGIKVESGKPCTDPRLQEIDVTKYCRSIRVTVLGPDQKPLPGITVWAVVVRENGHSASGHSTDMKGVADLTVPTDGIHLSVVSSRGEYRSQHFEQQKQDLTVRMQPGWRARLQIGNLPKLPDNLRLRVVEEAVRPPQQPDWAMRMMGHRGTTYLGVGGLHEFWSPAAGKVTVKLYPAFANERNQWINGRGQFLQFEVEVDAKKTGVQVFPIKLDDENLELLAGIIEEAKERLKERK